MADVGSSGGASANKRLVWQASEDSQKEVIAFLSDPATHGGLPVDRVDTHISRIFLAGERAWKLKRARRTNFLDFSTLEQRERMCRRELEVNRLVIGIYIGMTPVVRRDGRLRLGGPGEPVEWLVEMRRFDRSHELDRLCDRGALTFPIVERLADEIAALHRAAPRTPGFGDPEDVKARIDQIADALEDACDERGFADAVARWRTEADATRLARSDMIDNRCRLGRVRRCHGDLHLGNVVLLGGRPTPFDAIEFNESIASIDVLYDLAMALSDLLTRGCSGLANGLLNRYLSMTRDYGGLPLLPLYVSMRGAVRAMTAASRGASEEATRGLGFATEALRQVAEPRLIAIGGISGTGKSTLARSLAPRIAPLAGAVIIRSDVVRKRVYGARPESRLPEAAYTGRMDAKVLARMAYVARVALRAGFPVVLDATFLRKEARDCAAAVARAEGVRFDGIWLVLPADEAVRRVEGRGPDASDATAGVVARQASRTAPSSGWAKLQAGRPLEDVLSEAEGRLAAQG